MRVYLVKSGGKYMATVTGSKATVLQENMKSQACIMTDFEAKESALRSGGAIIEAILSFDGQLEVLS